MSYLTPEMNQRITAEHPGWSMDEARRVVKGRELLMCQIDSSVPNVVTNKGVLRMSAFAADAINSRNITPEARRQARVKLIKAREKIRTMWCGKHGFPFKENGECADCVRERNTRLAAELGSRDGTFPRACDCGWSDFVLPSVEKCPKCDRELEGRNGN